MQIKLGTLLIAINYDRNELQLLDRQWETALLCLLSNSTIQFLSKKKYVCSPDFKMSWN